MTVFILLLILGYMGYRAIPQRPRATRLPSHAPPRRRGPKRRAKLAKRSSTPSCGAFSHGCAARTSIFTPPQLCCITRPGWAFPTAEIDHLAVTPFGLFVFETKNWNGDIEPGPDDDTLVRVAPGGDREPRRSPVRQNRTKVAFLRSVMPGMWPVEGFGVFASEQCSLSAALPVTLIPLRGSAARPAYAKSAIRRHGAEACERAGGVASRARGRRHRFGAWSIYTASVCGRKLLGSEWLPKVLRKIARWYALAISKYSLLKPESHLFLNVLSVSTR